MNQQNKRKIFYKEREKNFEGFLSEVRKEITNQAVEEHFKKIFQGEKGNKENEKREDV